MRTVNLSPPTSGSTAYGVLLLSLGLVPAIAPRLAPAQTAVASPTHQPTWDTYQQRLTIEFASSEAAQQAEVALEPLFNGSHRAVSCRWDDNWTSDNEKTRDVMQQFGVRGTWYLNGQYFYPGGQPADYLPVARRLLAGGNSIGGHSLTHPYLTYFHSNRMFAETSGVRINWEAALDLPVVSYAYSFVDLRPLPEDRQVLARTLASLERAGIYHVAEFLDFFNDLSLRLELSPIMPPENSPFAEFEQAVDWAYSDANLGDEWPMISNSMHAWYDTERLHYGYDELRKRLEKLASLENVWHCNQNEYAAYRRQVRSTEIEIVDRRANQVEVAIRKRPLLLELNDAIPITMAVTGVSPDQVVAIRCPTADVTAAEQASATERMFHVGHDRQQRLPRKIGHVANPDNLADLSQLAADPDFPLVQGGLVAEGDLLRLQVKCTGAAPLEAIRVTWRLPIGWEQPRLATSIHDDASEFSITCPLQPTDIPLDRLGRAHFAAQLDFRQAGEAGRIHFTCQRPGETPDQRWPLDNFAMLGPIPREQFDAARFADQVVSNGCPAEYLLDDGTRLAWRKAARDGYVTHEWLNPEYLRTMGTWDADAPSYVLRSRITSPTERPVKFVVSQAPATLLVVNGVRTDADQAILKAGENELVVVYPGRAMQSRNDRLCACFLRIVDASTGQRLDDITYQAY